VELSCRCLGCGMGLFFEGVSVGDGEGDETRGAAFDAELEASETTEEADEEGAEAVAGVGSGGRGCCEVEGEAADGRCSPCPGNPPMDEEAGDM